jgi:flagellin
MTSINTNVGALVALRNLNMTGSEVEITQDRVSTGLRVVGPKDDASNFSIAQGIRADLKAFDAVQQSLSSGKGVVAAAIAGATSISNLLADIKKKAIEASNPANTASQQTILSNDFNSMINQLNSFVSNSVYNGRNLISRLSSSVSITSTISGGQLTLGNASVLGNVSSNLSIGVATTTQALSLIAQVDAEITSVGNALGQLGASAKDIDFLTTFSQTLSDAVTEGLGSLVDADLAKESARLQALQVKQQLGVQALSIANQRPQIILSLFRGG